MEIREQHLKNRTLFISCVVPCYNESAGLAQFVDALCVALSQWTDVFEVILVDDGSRDHSALVMQQLVEKHKTVKALLFSRRFGKEAALSAGLCNVLGAVTLLIDADFQHPLSMIEAFLKQWQQGYDMVYGIQDDRAHQSWMRRQLSQLFYYLMQRMTAVDIPPHAGDFRLLDRCVVSALNQCQERARFMKGLYAWVGFKCTGIPYVPTVRYQGKSRWRLGQLAELALTGITAFSSVPLRIWGVIGLMISLLSLGYGGYIITATLWYGVDAPGFATIITAVMFLGGIQLLSIGILGEYMSRVFDEVKQRPHYIVMHRLGFDQDVV